MLPHETTVGSRRSSFRMALGAKSSTVGHPTVTRQTGNQLIVITCAFIFRISLNTMTLQVESPTVYTSQGVPISVTGIAQVKIQGQNEDMLLTACEQFLGKSEAEIQHIALVTLEGHQRAIMGSMTVEEIYKDRKKFSKQVFEVASSDLVNMGITVVSYTLKDIRDEEVRSRRSSILNVPISFSLSVSFSSITRKVSSFLPHPSVLVYRLFNRELAHTFSIVLIFVTLLLILFALDLVNFFIAKK